MHRVRLLIMVSCLLPAGVLRAQDATSPQGGASTTAPLHAPAGADSHAARPAANEDLEPAVNTSNSPPERAEPAPAASAGAAPTAGAGPTAAAAAPTGAAAVAGAASSGAAVSPGAAGPAASGAAASVGAAPSKAAASGTAAGGPRGARTGTGKAADRLELDTTQITGNRELPKVLYIVPWKRSDLGDLVGKPVNSLLDEVLQPVDRDVFKRENRYYRALAPGGEGSAAGAAGAAQNPAAAAK